MRLCDVAGALEGVLHGDGDLEIAEVSHPAEATTSKSLALAMAPKLLPLLSASKARAAVVAAGCTPPEGAVAGWIEVGRPRLAMAGITDLFKKPEYRTEGVHELAVVMPGAVVGKNVSIGPLAYIGPDAKIGDDATVMPQVTVGAGAEIGSDCLLHPGARIGERVIIGDRSIVHHNASIGADGFSFVTPEPGSVESAKRTGQVEAVNVTILRINSIGTVIVGEDCEIGANTSIDRGTISGTRIGRGTKIDNQVMIGHNVSVGENCMLCGQVGIAGSAVIGDRVVLAGQVGVVDHATIGDDVVVAAQSGVIGNLEGRAVYYGTPAAPKARKMRELAMLSRIGEFATELRHLVARVEGLESARRESGRKKT